MQAYPNNKQHANGPMAKEMAQRSNLPTELPNILERVRDSALRCQLLANLPDDIDNDEDKTNECQAEPNQHLGRQERPDIVKDIDEHWRACQYRNWS